MKWLKKVFGSKPKFRDALFTEFGLFSSAEGVWHWPKRPTTNLDILKVYEPTMNISEAVCKHITSNKPDSICILASAPAWHIIVRSGQSARHFDTSMDNDEMGAVALLLKQDYNLRGHDDGCFVWDAAK